MPVALACLRAASATALRSAFGRPEKHNKQLNFRIVDA